MWFHDKVLVSIIFLRMVTIFGNSDTHSLHLWNFNRAHTPTSNCSGLLIITLCILAVVHTTDMLSQRHQKHCHHCNNFYCVCSFVIWKWKKKCCAIFVDAQRISTQCFFAKSGFCSSFLALPRLMSPIEAEGADVILALPRCDVWKHLLSVRVFGLGAWTAYLESSRILFRFRGVFLFSGTYREAISSQDVFVEARLRACPVNLVTFPAFFFVCFLCSWFFLLQKDVNLFVSNEKE